MNISMQMIFLKSKTPMMIKSTPEGARDYVVRAEFITENFMLFPQSPQIYKQLLMVSDLTAIFSLPAASVTRI